MPIVGLLLGLALASKWVAALRDRRPSGSCILARSALGRLVVVLGSRRDDGRAGLHGHRPCPTGPRAAGTSCSCSLMIGADPGRRRGGRPPPDRLDRGGGPDRGRRARPPPARWSRSRPSALGHRRRHLGRSRRRSRWLGLALGGRAWRRAFWLAGRLGLRPARAAARTRTTRPRSSSRPRRARRAGCAPAGCWACPIALGGASACWRSRSRSTSRSYLPWVALGNQLVTGLAAREPRPDARST